MRHKIFFFSFLLALFSSFHLDQALACESCTIPRMGREIETQGAQKPWFVDVTFEQQNWDERPAEVAHELHEEGHHIHNKTHEEFYHFTLGATPQESLTLLAELPYVVRHSTEIEDHDRLGEKEESQGVGDLSVFALYQFLRQNKNYLGVLGGIKFPTGQTEEENSQGVLFEPELQPGTGSYDYPVGLIYQVDANPFILRGNAIYVLKTEGDQEFAFGDLFSTSLFLDYQLLPEWKGVEMKTGLDLNFQHEQKQIEEGEKVSDSGGSTLLLGPTLSIQAGEQVSVFTNLLFPVYQNLGGEHQELDFVWTGGAKVRW